MSSSGAPKSASGSRSNSPARSGTSRSRAGSTSSAKGKAAAAFFNNAGKQGEKMAFDPATWALRPKEGVSKRLELPVEAYFRVSLLPHDDIAT
jgi:hypothetical protein